MEAPDASGIIGPFTLDGMVQALTFRDGRVDFRNRWIRTPKYVAEERAGRALFEWADGDFGDWRSFGWGEVARDEFTRGVPQGTNNINVVPFAGSLLALGEQGSPPVALDPITLDTKGIVPWSTCLSAGIQAPACFGDAAFTAHPKWDPDTGELYGWAYSDTQALRHAAVGEARRFVRSRSLDEAPYASLTHDMWLTENYVVLPFQPLVVGQQRVARGMAFFGWEPDLPVTLAVIDRHDFDAPIRWLELDVEAEYVLHTMSANESENTLVLDAPIYDTPPFPLEQTNPIGTDYVPMATTQMGRWTVNLSTGQVTSERVDDRAVEFPKVDERFYGKPYEWGFLMAGPEMWSLRTVVRRNVRTGKEDSYTIERDAPVSIFEPTFAPRSTDADEADGYLIVPVSRFVEHVSEFLIFDTEGIGAGPITRIELPFQLGWTPHGHWMPF